MNCPNCGSSISQGEMFCNTCGAMVFNSHQNNTMTSQQNNMMMNQSNDDEVLIDAYIGVNAEKLKHGGFSWCTLIFGLIYAFYRKMWLFGFIWILINLVLAVVLSILIIKFPIVLALVKVGNYPISSIIAFISSFVINIIMSFMFKKIYIKKVTKKVEQIKQQNIGKTNEELVKVCSKKGGTTIFGIIAAITLIEIIPTLLVALLNMINLNEVNQSAAEDTAYSIISSVEYAHALTSLNSKDGSITLEQIRQEYDSKFSTWNEDNTIIPNDDDFICNVTVNDNNEMLVSCDVDGEVIESNLLSLRIETNNENTENNNTNDGQNNQTNDNSNQDINNDGNNNETEGELSVKKTSSDTITFYKNEKEIGKYQCDGVDCGVCGSSLNICSAFNSDIPINKRSKIALYDTNDKATKVVIFDVNNNRVIEEHLDIVDSYNLNNKYIIVKNRNNKTAILDNNYEYVKNYSNKQFVYRSAYGGNDNFNAEKDMIITIENNKYGIEKISEDKIIINHKYDNIALTDGITVYSYNGTNNNYYYTDEIYQNKYFKAKTGDKWYLYYLNTGEKVINKGYDRLYLIDGNTIAVYSDGYISFIDYNGKTISEDKIKVSIPSGPFYRAPEGILFRIEGNIVNITVFKGVNTTETYSYQYNLSTRKLIN